MSKMKIRVHEGFGGPCTPKELKHELSKVVADFHKYIGEHMGFDRYDGTVAYYITDLGYNSTEDDKKEALDVLDLMQNELLQLRGMIEDTPVPAPVQENHDGYPEGFSNEGPYRIRNRGTGAYLTATFPGGKPSWSVDVNPMKFLSRTEAGAMIKELREMGEDTDMKRIEVVKV